MKRADTLREVWRVLPADHGERPCDIAKRLRHLAPTTVRHALRELVADGRATFDGADCCRRYRRTGGEG